MPISAAVQAITSNPVETRSDLVSLLTSLLAPILDARSDGGARITLGHTGAPFDVVAAEMEGYARALWGLAPLMASEPDNKELAEVGRKWREGLDAGTDPSREDEFWGIPTPYDQRFVEMAAIGIALAIAPATFWDPLSPAAKKRVNSWLLECNDKGFPPNNWRFFRVLVNLGLKAVDAEYSQKAIDDELEFMEFYIGPHGFPSDCPSEDKYGAYDYYATSFAIPFYSLLYAAITSRSPKLADPERAERYRQRARENVPHLIHLFAPDGAAIPFGRSMTYRFATSCFWAAVVYDGIELPAPYSLGMIKGVILRNIRSFTQKPEVFNRDGSLSIGWFYPNQFMSEDYNSPQSPYWALKSFFILALPASHPFWQAKEEPFPSELLQKPWAAVKPWMQVYSHAAGHTLALSAGQNVAFPLRGTAEKYNKFAYSSAFGFSVPTGALNFQQHAPDSALALSDDGGRRWMVPFKVEHLGITDRGVIKARWYPWPEVEVHTWLIPPPSTTAPYHTRVHQVQVSPSFNRDLLLADSGFAIHSTFGHIGSEKRILKADKPSEGEASRSAGRHWAVAVSRKGVSGVIDILTPTTQSAQASTGESSTSTAKTDVKPDSKIPDVFVINRTAQEGGSVEDVDANTNIISPRTVIPTIYHKIHSKGAQDVKETWIASRVWALPFTEREGLKTAGWLESWRRDQQGWHDVDSLKKDLGVE